MGEEAEAGSDTDTGEEGSHDEAAGAEGTLLTEGQADEGEGSGSDEEGGEGGEGEGGEAGGVPETYEFEMPEGMEMDQALNDAVSPVMKELGLDQEQASKLASVYAETMQKQATDAAESFGKQQEDWKSELKTDQDFGGENFDKNTAMVTEFIQATVPEELKEDVIGLLDSTGAGNHPGLVKYIHHLAKTFPVGEGQGSSSSGVNKDPATTREERMYPNN